MRSEILSQCNMEIAIVLVSPPVVVSLGYDRRRLHNGLCWGPLASSSHSASHQATSDPASTTRLNHRDQVNDSRSFALDQIVIWTKRSRYARRILCYRCVDFAPSKYVGSNRICPQIAYLHCKFQRRFFYIFELLFFPSVSLEEKYARLQTKPNLRQLT